MSVADPERTFREEQIILRTTMRTLRPQEGASVHVAIQERPYLYLTAKGPHFQPTREVTMRILYSFTLFLVPALLAIPAAVHAAGGCETAEAFPQTMGQLKDDRVLVQLTTEAADLASTSSEHEIPRGIAELDDLLKRRGIWQGHRLIRTHGVPIGDPELFTATGLERWYVLILPEPGQGQVQSLIHNLRRLPAVERVEVVAVEKLLGIPNDPLFDLQWHHHNTGQTGGTDDADIDSPEAWEIETGNQSTVIGFLDSGVEHTHEDLVGGIIAGYNFVDDNSDTEDEYGHGTITAGLAAARGDNGIGVAGVCYGCIVMPLKIADSEGWVDTENVIDAIRWGADSGVDVIGSMTGGRYRSQAMADSVQYAMGAVLSC